MKNIVVFCGSKTGVRDEYRQTAAELGTHLVARSMQLVYGGGHVGLMGVVADAVLAQGGTVIGVIPQFLKDWEVAHRSVSELIVTQTMHERKARMAELADAFVALPGGFGTLDELFEILTWKQLYLHSKPIVLLNVTGFFDPLLSMVERMIEEGFVQESNRSLLHVATNLDELFTLLQTSTVSEGPRETDTSKV